MKNNRAGVLCLVASLALGVSAVAQEEDAATPMQEGNGIVNAVVKLEVQTAKSNIGCPWANYTDSSSGSEVVIAKGRILTCAHCVVDASYIRVRKHNEDSVYHATVLFVDNDADLALVGVEDTKFMADIVPLEIGETPHIQDDVLAIGYPIGGVNKDLTKAFNNFRKAAEGEHAKACYNLSVCHSKGLGTPKDEVLAKHWKQEVVNRGFEK